jgi:hypothetical protein
MTESITMTARAIDLNELHRVLTLQHARKVEAVVPAADIRATAEGNLVLGGTAAEITDEGVTMAAGTYRPTEICNEGLSAKLDIPRAYLRRLHASRPDAWAYNVNTMLEEAIKADSDRTFLVRCFQGGDGEIGVARAFLSDRFGLHMDNLDALMAVLEGVRQAGVEVDIPAGGADLSERGMRLRIVAPGVQAYGPALLANYRSPFADPSVHRFGHGGWTPARALAAAQAEGGAYEPGTEPVLFMGLEVSNSELGGGSWSIAPVVVAQVCSNGLQCTSYAVKAPHLGGKLEAGVIRWSTDTQRKNAGLITAKTRDAVHQYFDPAFIAARVAELEVKAGAPVTDAVKTVEVLGKALMFSEAEQATILNHFILGAQPTAGGMMQAVSSAAQTVADPDRAHEIEATAVQALELVYANR